MVCAAAAALPWKRRQPLLVVSISSRASGEPPACTAGVPCQPADSPCYCCREIERQQRAADMGFVHNSSAAAKRQRAAVFASWLVQQYRKESLNAGAGVLDVAGVWAL